ncbi:hypothetical protein POX_c04171 [Penicillium oxalicum]|uniref:Uncharacterized protein n=1 Tax=Penicillium oxalicum (strain 114-2 / CGMCC 5302) TaxID=933388 RepID=S7ZAU2_PENO1|nr:hypothetical protein POX_c04171 [Penicillium oxalicum]EPS25801.1 hypothetical protein PDE_00737 [Penicillium oxalicum 114-2]KAI2791314.1 hypothetical protein POX_c04171 [Penicillium oxalicum]
MHVSHSTLHSSYSRQEPVQPLWNRSLIHFHSTPRQFRDCASISLAAEDDPHHRTACATTTRTTTSTAPVRIRRRIFCAPLSMATKTRAARTVRMIGSSSSWVNVYSVDADLHPES